MHLAILTLDLRTKKYPVPLARHTSLQRSLGETPAYLGTHSTPSPEPSDTWADMSLCARHCSSRNDRPEKGTQRGQIYCLFSLTIQPLLTFTPVCEVHQKMTSTDKPERNTVYGAILFHVYFLQHVFKKVFTTCRKLYPRLAISMSLKDVLPLVSGQVSVLQERYWILLPSQYLPPFLGRGLSQERKEYCTPPPQVREQSPQGPHTPQPPLTGV